ncbi:MAG: hypothetical protein EU548_02360 [Promethearchaeota archaeon]|nr:MAG: hypothetical protein EU548_02360 [Candidatus Lokiarchaeota archaeon]
MTLTPDQYLNGFYSLLVVVLFTFVGIKIALKYRINNEKTYIYVGLTWIGVVEAYYAVSISYVFAIFNGVGIPAEIYFLIGVSFYPLSTIFWITAFTQLLIPERKRIFQLIFICIGVTFEVLFFILFFGYPQLLGSLLSPVDSQFGLIIRLYLIFSLAVIFITGMIISIVTIRSSLRTNQLEFKLRGIFLSITLITFVSGAGIDASLELNAIPLTIVRLMLITSAVFLYLAFIMPKWVLKLFKKE